MAFEDNMPHDIWIDIETGEWGLATNLRLVHQTDLPASIGNPTPATKAEVRCAGIDHGTPLSMDERMRHTKH